MEILFRKDAVLGVIVVALSLLTLYWLIPVGIALVVQAFVAPKLDLPPDLPPDEPAFSLRDAYILPAAGVLALYMWAMTWGGLVVPSILTLGAMIALHGERRLAVLLPVAIGVPVVLYLLFVKVARMSIPLGVFEPIFG
jgi:hypothetical protein